MGGPPIFFVGSRSCKWTYPTIPVLWGSALYHSAISQSCKWALYLQCLRLYILCINTTCGTWIYLLWLSDLLLKIHLWRNFVEYCLAVGFSIGKILRVAVNGLQVQVSLPARLFSCSGPLASLSLQIANVGSEHRMEAQTRRIKILGTLSSTPHLALFDKSSLISAGDV